MNFYDSFKFQSCYTFYFKLNCSTYDEGFSVGREVIHISSFHDVRHIFPTTTEENTEQCNYLREIISKIIKCWQKKFINLTT